MAKLPKPYLKCQEVRGEYVLTLMGSGSRGHVLVGRETIAMGEPELMRDTVIAMVNKARGVQAGLEIQADGNS